MVTVVTRQGRRIEVIYQSELCDPLNMGEYVRAYCHIHGSDHQRSLSINKLTGWVIASMRPVMPPCWLLSGILWWQNACCMLTTGEPCSSPLRPTPPNSSTHLT